MIQITKKNLTFIILGCMMHFSTANAASLYLSCNDSLYYCPPDSAIFVTLTIDKSTYATNEAMTLFGYAHSDDNPVPAAISLSGLGVVNHPAQGVWSQDVFPSTYSAQDLRGSISGSESLGNASSSAGSYTVSLSSGSGYYLPDTGTISFTVVAPSIDVHFGFLDRIKHLFTSFFDTTVNTVFADSR